MSTPDLFLAKTDFCSFIVHGWTNHFKTFAGVKQWVEDHCGISFKRDYLKNGQILCQSDESISLIVNAYYFKIEIEGKCKDPFERAQKIGKILKNNFKVRICRLDIAFDFLNISPENLINPVDLKFKYEVTENRGHAQSINSIYYKNSKYLVVIYNKLLELSKSRHPKAKEALQIYPNDKTVSRLEIRLRGRSVIKNSEAFFFSFPETEAKFIYSTLKDFSKNKFRAGVILELASKGESIPTVKDVPLLRKQKIRGFGNEIFKDPEVERWLKAAINRSIKNGWEKEKVDSLLSELWARAKSPMPTSEA